MPCDLCKRASPMLDAISKRECAFEHVVFSPNNWNCATVNALRDLATAAGTSTWVIPLECDGVLADFLVLGWYKSRGRTEAAWLIDGEQIEPLSLQYAVEILGSVADAADGSAP